MVEPSFTEPGNSRSEPVRIERDSMGEVAVPAAAKYQAQTQRAVDNFPVSGQRIDRELIGALASTKGASARLRGSRAASIQPRRAPSTTPLPRSH